VIVLFYHNVVAHPPNAFNILARKEWVEEREFARQMAVVAERFRVVPLREIAEAVRRGQQIPDACAITFDDGYLGTYRYGLPVLERYGLPATLFVVTRQVRGEAGSRPDRFDRLEAVLQTTTRDNLDLTDLGFGFRKRASPST
jgi:peptidoglycan/xylan/chitin deacetylase (PgdA/CDA1 family)